VHQECNFGVSDSCVCSGLQLYARRGVHFHALVRSNPQEALRVVATAVKFRTGRNDFNLDWTARCCVLEIRNANGVYQVLAVFSLVFAG